MKLNGISTNGITTSGLSMNGLTTNGTGAAVPSAPESASIDVNDLQPWTCECGGV